MCELVEAIASSLFELEVSMPKRFEVFEIEVSQDSWISIVKSMGDLIVTGKYAQPFELFGKHLTINHDAKDPFALKTRVRREEA